MSRRRTCSFCCPVTIVGHIPGDRSSRRLKYPWWRIEFYSYYITSTEWPMKDGGQNNFSCFDPFYFYLLPSIPLYCSPIPSAIRHIIIPVPSPYLSPCTRRNIFLIPVRPPSFSISYLYILSFLSPYPLSALSPSFTDPGYSLYVDVQYVVLFTKRSQYFAQDILFSSWSAPRFWRRLIDV